MPQGTHMTSEIFRRCERLARLAAGICAVLAVLLLASSSDVAPGLDFDEVRLLGSRVFQWAKK
jgi:hypothetical protein